MKLGIKNYRSISKAVLELSDGITAFIGPSDSGKSNVFRAIRDFWYNRSGDGHLMAGENTAKVVMGPVAWEKGDKVNRYTLGKKVFDKVGRGVVPEEVQEKIGVREVEFGEGISRRLNIVEQFSVPFMLGDKGSDNAKIIGSLSGIGIVFNALRDATADHGRAVKESAKLEQDAEGAKKDLTQFIFLKKLIPELESIKGMISEIKQDGSYVSKLNKLMQEWIVAKRESDAASGAIGKLQKISEIDIDAIDSLLEQLDEMKGLFCDFDRANIELDGAAESVCRLRGASELDVSGLHRVLGQVVLMNGLVSEYGGLAEAVKLAGKEAKTAKKNVDIAQEELDEYVKEVDVCPIAGIPMPEECKEAMANPI